MGTANKTNLQDVFVHLANLKSDFARMMIDYNREHLIVYAMESYTKKIHLIEQIIKSYDGRNIKQLTNRINLALIESPELHRVQVLINIRLDGVEFDRSKSTLIIHEL